MGGRGGGVIISGVQQMSSTASSIWTDKSSSVKHRTLLNTMILDNDNALTFTIVCKPHVMSCELHFLYFAVAVLM